MQVSEALAARKSVRAFLDTPVSAAEVEELLTRAMRAPSWSNTQPYRVAYAVGDACEALRKEFLKAVETEAPAPDVPLLFDYPSPLKERRKACGVGLYQALGIAREDQEGRAAQFRANYAFFGAPAVVFFFAHRALEGHAALDLGCLLQSFLLAATERGLGTCAQAALASHPAVVRRAFDVDAEYALYCGVALGHADEGAAINAFSPPRVALDQILVPPVHTREGED